METTTTATTLAHARRGPVDPARGVEVLYGTGHWLLTSDRPEDAATVFRGMALLAPRDERAWLGLGACHEAVDQPALALEMYGTGLVLERRAVRLWVARARLLRTLGQTEEADEALRTGEEVAEALGDEALIALVAAERGGP